MRAVAMILCGPEGSALEQALLAVERDEPDAADLALAELGNLPASPRRRVLASYNAMARATRRSDVCAAG